MGRKKIELKRIECVKERSSKYSKRKKGLLKKAEEISKLCEVDIALLAFSPTNKHKLFTSRPLSKILERLSKFSLQDREDRKAYTIKTLKKMYKNNAETPTENQQLACERDEGLEDDDKILELKNVREMLDEKTSVLRDWQNPYGVDELDRLDIMEKYLISSLSKLKIRKMKIQEQDKESLE